MKELPFVNLPDEFSRMLQLNMQTQGENYKKLDIYIQSEPSLNSLVKLHFRDLDKEARPGMVIKAMGWPGFRDRLAVIYLSYLEKRSFHHLNNLLCSELLVFEDRLKRFSVEGHSRSFLLAFYLKAASLTEGNAYSGRSMTQILSPDIFKLIKGIKAKMIPIDWLILNLWHFYEFFGEEILRKSITKKVGLEEMMKFLSQEQRELMFRNLLSYGASIQDLDFFMPRSA